MSDVFICETPHSRLVSSCLFVAVARDRAVGKQQSKAVSIQKRSLVFIVFVKTQQILKQFDSHQKVRVFVFRFRCPSQELIGRGKNGAVSGQAKSTLLADKLLVQRIKLKRLEGNKVVKGRAVTVVRCTFDG